MRSSARRAFRAAGIKRRGRVPCHGIGAGHSRDVRSSASSAGHGTLLDYASRSSAALEGDVAVRSWMQQSADVAVDAPGSSARRPALAWGRLAQAPPSAEEQGFWSDRSRRWAPAAGLVAQVANLKTGTRRSPRPDLLSAQEAGWRIRPSVARGCPLDLHDQRNGLSPQHVPAWGVWRRHLPGLRAKGPAVGAGCGLVRGRKSNHARRKACSATPRWAWLRWLRW